MYRSFEELEVWQRSSRIAVRIYELTRNHFDPGLKNQMTRAAVSVASNIAEGAERNSAKEFSRFLYIARGSAAELRTQIYIAYKIGMIDQETKNTLVNELVEISKMLFGLAQSINN
ncbi:MAG: four helix bundle protein [Pontiellaceae bacterium]|nr:four helix bundle protein [Pontiellaceae bacterium]